MDDYSVALWGCSCFVLIMSYMLLLPVAARGAKNTLEDEIEAQKRGRK